MAKGGGKRGGRLSSRGSLGGKSSKKGGIISNLLGKIGSFFGRKPKGMGGNKTGGQSSRRMSIGK